MTNTEVSRCYKEKKNALVHRIQMVQVAVSVVLGKSRPAENTLDLVDINASSTCRTEKRFCHWTAVDGKYSHHFNPI